MMVTMGMVVAVLVVVVVAVRTVPMAGLSEDLARHALQQPGSRSKICLCIDLVCMSLAFCK